MNIDIFLLFGSEWAVGGNPNPSPHAGMESRQGLFSLPLFPASEAVVRVRELAFPDLA